MSIRFETKMLGNTLVTRRPFDMERWGFDLEKVRKSTSTELQRIKPLNGFRAWYVNPFSTVASCTPDEHFFREARKQLHALYTCMQSCSGKKWEAQRWIDKVRLTWEEFSLAYDGVVIIDGEIRERRDLRTVENECLGNLSISPFVDTETALKAHDVSVFQNYLKASRDELKSCTTACWFVVPSCKIVAESHSLRFEAECKRQWKLWKAKLYGLRTQGLISPRFAADVRKLRCISQES